MQLPRGTFREIKRGISVSVLLGELEKTGFSGICSFSFAESTGTLVFKAGKGILAKFLNRNGDAAWDELQKILDEEVDAALSTLDEAQIQLSLEFNKSSRLVKWALATPAKPPAQKAAHPHADHPATPAPHHVPSPPQVPYKVPPRAVHPAVPLATPTERAPAFHTPPAPAQKPIIPPRPAPSARVPVAPPVQEPPAEKKNPESEETNECSGPSSFDNDIDTFDSMDLENVTAKIRSDCKTMIKQLNLEHLIDR